MLTPFLLRCNRDRFLASARRGLIEHFTFFEPPISEKTNLECQILWIINPLKS